MAKKLFQFFVQLANSCAMLVRAIFFLAIFAIVANSQVTQSPEVGGAEHDEHLHSQIPPSHRQPTEDEVKDAISELLDGPIDKDQDGVLDSLELRNWLDRTHKLIIDDNLARQWQYFSPQEQEVHSWEGYAVRLACFQSARCLLKLSKHVYKASHSLFHALSSGGTPTSSPK